MKQSGTYRVQLTNFEGPLDLLLFFIRRDELDIYDIPISYITEQFLEYVRFLDELDLAVASEFIYMASTLMAIKARMMIPQPDTDEEEFNEDDPRFELVQALLEYKRYKEASEEMIILDQKARLSYVRGYHKIDRVEPEQKGEALREVTLIDIMAAFHLVIREIPADPYHEVRKFETDVQTQSAYVTDFLMKQGKASFRQLCKGMKTRIYVIVTFLAVLELIKENQVKLLLTASETDFYLELFTADELEDFYPKYTD